MPDSKITALTSISTSTDPANDPLVIVDVSDTSMAATGTTKKVTLNQLLGASGTATLASATITGDLTVDTSTLKVDSANNFVGVGTTTGVNLAAGRGNLTIGGSSSAILNLSIGATDTGYVIHDGTSIYLVNRIAAGSLIFSTNSTERFRIDSSGNVGVGVTPSAKLDVSANDGTMAIFRSSGGSSNDKRLTISSGGAKVVFNISDNSNTAIARAYEFQTAGSAAMTLDASGNLLVGTTAVGMTAGGVRIKNASGTVGEIALSNNSGSADYVARFFWGSTPTLVGNITVASGGTTYNTTSDYRLKKDVHPLVGGLARVSALKPSVYNWKTDGSAGEGFLAHELAEVVPFAVIGEKDAVNEDGSIKPQGVDMSRVVPILVAAIQELTARVQTLEAK